MKYLYDFIYATDMMLKIVTNNNTKKYIRDFLSIMSLQPYEKWISGNRKVINCLK